MSITQRQASNASTAIKEPISKSIDLEAVDQKDEEELNTILSASAGPTVKAILVKAIGHSMDAVDDKEEEDADYDPAADIADENDAESESDQDDDDVTDEEDAVEPTEEEIVNSETFEAELLSAIDMVTRMGKIDREKILKAAHQEYINDTGLEPSDEMLTDAMKMFAMDVVQTEDDSEAEYEELESGDDEIENEIDDECEDELNDIEPELFEKEMNEALDVVRALGKVHQKALVATVSDIFVELNAYEPNAEELSSIFERVKLDLAEEAKEDFIETNDVDDDESNDSDYTPTAEDVQEVADDEALDALGSDADNESSDDDDEDSSSEEESSDAYVEEQTVKILVTPIKHTPAGSKIGVYLRQQKDTKETLEAASTKFELINKRAPTQDDAERLQRFLETGKLFETEVDPRACELNDDECLESEESSTDADYDPDTDTYDYSNDIEDDLECCEDRE